MASPATEPLPIGVSSPARGCGVSPPQTEDAAGGPPGTRDGLGVQGEPRTPQLMVLSVEVIFFNSTPGFFEERQST